jgi:hypothetical protein
MELPVIAVVLAGSIGLGAASVYGLLLFVFSLLKSSNRRFERQLFRQRTATVRLGVAPSEPVAQPAAAA